MIKYFFEYIWYKRKIIIGEFAAIFTSLQLAIWILREFLKLNFENMIINKIEGFWGLIVRILILIALMFVIAVIEFVNRKFSSKVNQDGDVIVSIKVCDMFKEKGTIIIPTNTTFDTNTKNGFINKNSVQGQYQVKYYRNDTRLLDEKITKSLEKDNNKIKILSDRNETKKKRFEIGTVCEIEEEDRKVYLVADSNVNNHGKPEKINYDTLDDVLVKLWKYISKCNYSEVINVPLIGTGFCSSNISKEKAIDHTILTAVLKSKERKFCDELCICIHPKDVECVSMDHIETLLKYYCVFYNTNDSNTKRIGKKAYK